MTKEKQIEIPKDEMGMSGYSKFAWGLWHQLKLPMDICEKVDRFVREQGYREQSVGEWIKVAAYNDGILNTVKCSVCGTYQPAGMWDYHPYCPFCGAKMKRR